MIDTQTVKIAELKVDVDFHYSPMLNRIKEFRTEGDFERDFVIETFQCENLNVKEENIGQREVVFSAQNFFLSALEKNRFLAHAVAVVVCDEAYMIIAPQSGGKSTHIQFWKQILGQKARILSDDHPIIGLKSGKPYIWNSPWSKYTEIAGNSGFPLRGVCYLKKLDSDKIQRIDMEDLIELMLVQYPNTLDKDKIKGVLEIAFNNIPMYELFSRKDESGAKLLIDMLLGDNVANI